MKSFVWDVGGGLAIIAIASVVGLAHNAFRERPVKLIETVKPVSTVNRAGEGAKESPDDPDGSAFGVASSEDALTAQQVKKMIEQASVVVIDARSAEAFESGHIAGSINVPYDRLPEYYERLTELVPVDAAVIIYCWGPTCDFADQLATELKIVGYENVRVFTGGWEHWESAGYPVEGSEVNN